MEEEHILVPSWTLMLSGDSELPAGFYSRFWRRGTLIYLPVLSKHSPVQPACQVPSPCKSGFSSGQLAPAWMEKQEAPPMHSQPLLECSHGEMIPCISGT